LIGDIDTLIAAMALEHDLTIITTDGDYTRVPGLAVQLLTMAQLRDP
jgi:predicted nucleic acid-binding protein